MIKKLKTSAYNLVREDGASFAGRTFNFIIIALIAVNAFAVIADTFTLSAQTRQVFYYIELVSTVIFTAEYILRLWTSDLKMPELMPVKARLKYIFSFMALIDLFAILPFYIPFLIPIDLRVLRVLRVIRLLRVFKVNRYTNALSSIAIVFKNKKSQLLSSVLVVALLMIVSSVLMYNIESAAQPEAFKNAFDALWWSVATLTTVGYGDIYPVTALGKIFSGIIALLGIGLVAVPTGIISAGFMEQTEKSNDNGEDKKKFCPYCGKRID